MIENNELKNAIKKIADNINGYKLTLDGIQINVTFNIDYIYGNLLPKTKVNFIKNKLFVIIKTRLSGFIKFIDNKYRYESVNQELLSKIQKDLDEFERWYTKSNLNIKDTIYLEFGLKSYLELKYNLK